MNMTQLDYSEITKMLRNTLVEKGKSFNFERISYFGQFCIILFNYKIFL